MVLALEKGPASNRDWLALVSVHGSPGLVCGMVGRYMTSMRGW